MILRYFEHVTQSHELTKERTNVHRVEIPLVAPDDFQYTVILLDAEDSFDIVVQNPDNTREIVWSMVKDSFYMEHDDEEDDDDD